MSVKKLEFNSVKQAKKGYTTFLNEVVQNITNGFILGVYTYLSTLPPEWEVNRVHLGKHFGVGRDKINDALSWLNNNYLIEYKQEHNDKGEFEKAYIEVQDGNEFIENFHKNQTRNTATLKTRSPDKPLTGKSAPIKNIRSFIKEDNKKDREATRKKTLALPLPDNFSPSKKNIDLALYRKLDPDIVIGKFIGHYKAKGTKQVDWQALLEKWILGEKIEKQKILSSKTMDNIRKEEKCPIKFWEPGNPDYDRVNGKTH